MAIDFDTKDIIHKITAKFVHASLPESKKPYNLRALSQPELDVHGIASKAEVYNIETDPKVIEEGLNAVCELVYYLVADGYKIKTPLLIRGYVLKIEGDSDHKAQTGLWFDDGRNSHIKAQIVAVNVHKTIKAIVPAGLTEGNEYTLKIVTQSSSKRSKTMLKNIREVRSDFKLTAHA